MMKRPLAMVALLYGAGVVIADIFRLPLVPLFTASLGAGLTALLWGRARPFLLGILLFLSGAANLTFRTAVLSPHDLRVVLADRADYLTMRGNLSETPYHRVYEQGGEEVWRTMAVIDVSFLRKNGGEWRPATGRVAVSTPGALPGHFFGGQTVEIIGIISPPRGPVAEGLFDYRTYLRRHGIYYQVQVATTNHWQSLSQTSSPPLADRFNAWAKATLARGLPVEDEPLRLLWAMTLGWKTGLGGEVSEPFMRSGTMHIFAISGLHIALIAGILVSLLRVCKVPRAACGLLVIPLIWFYTGVTGWQASAIRSTVMMTVIIAGWSLKRPSDLLNSLAAAAFIILLWDPQQLFQASFQLSFFVVLSLALFVPVFEALYSPLAHPRPGLPAQTIQRMVRKITVLNFVFPDPLLPFELRPRWQRWLRLPCLYVMSSFATSLAAWLGSIPLVGYYFHLFTPVSLLANLIVVPLSSLALMNNLASLITGGWFPACAELFNHSAWFWMLLMVRISQWCAALPGGCWNIASPTLVAFVLYYATLLSVLSGWLQKPRLLFPVGAGLIVLALIWFFQWKTTRSSTCLTILPLNGGNAIHLDAPGSKQDWLIDCGDASSVEFTTKPFLRAQGVNHLPNLLLTHGDLRHIGGAELIHRDFPARQIYFSQVRFRSPSYRRVQVQFEQETGLVKTIKRGDCLGPWTILHPESTDHFPQADDNTIAFLGKFHGIRILLLSDLGKPGQNALMERNANLRADIVVAGLPAQSEPLANALIEAIQPRLIIVTDAEFPATERASKKLQARLAQQNIPVLYTRETGAVTLDFRKDKWSLRTMKGNNIGDAYP